MTYLIEDYLDDIQPIEANMNILEELRKIKEQVQWSIDYWDTQGNEDEAMCEREIWKKKFAAIQNAIETFQRYDA